ncbi:ATP-binding cassette sub-family A member 3 isoform X2 [Bradysia coprophila]|uniref:ATP-binding cassette sub-family A member 3 isoform X2 n=1 Tax=Bradysia coprophila TaxID=38358 RepID=UPI00187D8591|nr:ATP-binding cassette sub-family A member 3 isoform X2 [Bradysia coprophila]
MANFLFMNTFYTFLVKHYKCWMFMWKSVVFTIVASLVLCWIPIFMFDKGVEQEKTFVSLPESDMLTFFPSGQEDNLMYTPNSTFNDNLIECLRHKLQIIEERVIAFPDEDMLLHYFEKHRTNRDFAIVFEPSENDDKEAPKKLNYTIRTRNNHFRTSDIYVNDVFEVAMKDIDEYIDSGFLALQQSLDRCYLEYAGVDLSSYEFEYQKFPFNARNAMFVGLEQIGFMLLVCTSFVLIVMLLIPLVQEKENGVKEFLRIATSYSYLNNFTLFILSLAVCMLLWIIVYVSAIGYRFIGHVDVCSVFVIAVCYLLSSVSFTFMVSVMFPSVFYAKVGSMLAFSLSFLVCWLNREKTRWLMPFFNNAMIVDTFSMIDSYGKRGLTFKIGRNANDHFEDYYSLGETLGFFLMDTILYLAVYYYFSQIFPGVYGTARPFYFPFTSLRCWKKSGAKSITSAEEGLNTSPDVAVRIHGLTKVFRSSFGRKSRVAVNRLTMDIPKNQITVLLGHNGAGKTTTMSMISGIISKTSGTISVNGEEDINRYRHMIGYCPQHNAFMRYFTVKGHLMFFAALRGLNKQDAESQVKQLLYKLHLMDKANEYGNNLSGGMKRRLCLGNAIVGNTQIAILDEPSSGLDPESRRQLWTILLDLRKDHTILLTTHYMEEAETLADKIFIIAYGEPLCSGTSIELKKKYSVGYILKLLTNESFNDDKTMETMNLINRYIPDAKIKGFNTPTLSVTLPRSDFNKYETMLEDLENHLAGLGISSISITNASLEEVFLSCDPRIMTQCNDSADEVDSTAYFPLDVPIDPKADYRIKQRQSWAIFYKKLIYMREQWCYWFLLFLCPIIALIICFGTIHSSITYRAPTESIQLDLAHINHPDVLLLMNHRDPLLHQRALEEIVENYNSSMRLLDSSVKSVKQEMLAIEMSNITYYNERLACGIAMQFDKQVGTYLVNILYSGNFLHSSPVAVNLVSNVLLHKATRGQYEIHVNNNPLMRDKLSVNKSDLDVFVFLIPFAMFMYMLFYVMLPFSEEVTEFRKLQNMPAAWFWLTNYVVDLLIHVVFTGIVYIVLILWDTHDIFEQEDYLTLATLLLFYGIAYIPLLYIIGQSFGSMSSLFSFLCYFFLIFSICSSFMSSSEDNMIKYETYIHLLLLFPDFTLRHAMNAMFIVYTKAQIAKQSSHFEHYSKVEFLPETSSYFDASSPMDLKKVYVYFTVVAICGLLFLLLVLENIYIKERILNVLKCTQCRKGSKASVDVTDDDVKEEHKLTELVVKENQIEEYPIVVSNLQKCYGDVNAVNGINFTVKKGECFGLLGMNGAGKTTTFKMMTRDITMSNGEIYFNGIGCNKTNGQANNVFGYCPQVDALDDFMTAYESLKFMALMRGLDGDRIDKEVKLIMEKTDLTKYANVRVSEYSGGTKRKLNTALAMITHPSLVFLDEPTTGVDPTSRRFMWSCIQDFQKNNKNIVLTSHSMDECEYLCNRLAIMAHGQLECIGSVQHLKNRYGKGFLLIVMINADCEPLDVSRVKSYMTDSFDCILREEYAGKLSYIVNNSKYKWSQVFNKLQTFLLTFKTIVYDISVLETSLEDIFLHFSRSVSGGSGKGSASGTATNQIARKTSPETEITVSSI